MYPRTAGGLYNGFQPGVPKILVGGCRVWQRCHVYKDNRFVACFFVFRLLCVQSGIKEYLQTYIRFPQTQRIFLAGETLRSRQLASNSHRLAGGSDSAYTSTIATLQSDGLLGKLTFVEASGACANQSRLRLPTLYVDNLFMTHQATPPSSATHHPPPLNVITGLSPSHVTGGLPTPRSPPSVPTPSTGKLIDPNLASK